MSEHVRTLGQNQAGPPRVHAHKKVHAKFEITSKPYILTKEFIVDDEKPFYLGIYIESAPKDLRMKINTAVKDILKADNRFDRNKITRLTQAEMDSLRRSGGKRLP